MRTMTVYRKMVQRRNHMPGRQLEVLVALIPADIQQSLLVGMLLDPYFHSGPQFYTSLI